MAGPTRDFWQQHFENGTIPWDRGGPSPQLLTWLRDVRAGDRWLVPGCGSGWEVAELADAGAMVTAIDYAPSAVAKARALIAGRDVAADIVEADVLQWAPSTAVDAVYEQTCLCALHPDYWRRYADQLHGWLKPGGRLYAMFMQKLRPGATEGFVEGPPFHCDIHAMRALLPADRWDWPKPPYPATPHAIGAFELGVVLTRR